MSKPNREIQKKIPSNIFEQASKNYLLAKGLKLITHNYRCRFGEIDLIMRDASTLIFIEVRFRKNRLYGGGAASVDRGKQKRLSLTAAHYLQCKRYNGNCRFDVVDVSYAKITGQVTNKNRAPQEPNYSNTASKLQFDWIQSAFMAQ